MDTAILLGLALLGAVIALWVSLKPMMDDVRIRKRVLNFDEGMKNYYFLPAQGEEETLAALADPPALKGTELSFRPEERVIVLAREGVEAAYRLQFGTDEGKTCLRVSRVAEEREQGTIPYLINALFIRELGAKPIDYRKGEIFFEE